MVLLVYSVLVRLYLFDEHTLLETNIMVYAKKKKLNPKWRTWTPWKFFSSFFTVYMLCCPMDENAIEKSLVCFVNRTERVKCQFGKFMQFSTRRKFLFKKQKKWFQNRTFYQGNIYVMYNSNFGHTKIYLTK